MSLDEVTLSQQLDFLIANAVNDALTFDFTDSVGGEVIHVNSNVPNDLNLTITNKLTVVVEITGEPGPASKSNHHFHIKFVNNKCFTNSPPLSLVTPNWSMTPVYDAGENVTDIYLLATKTIDLAAGTSISVQMRYIDAILENPLVPILQISVTVGANVKALLESGSQKVTGTEVLQLSAFTDVGVPTPLIANLVEPRTIPNDKTSWTALLRVVNTSADPVIFTAPVDSKSPTSTAVQLSVDLDKVAAWALCSPDEASTLTINPPANWLGSPGGEIGNNRKTWTFRPDYNQIQKIQPNSFLDFRIGGLNTTLPPGFTNLYVTFKDFPNYGTQTVVTQIEKSFLFYNPQLQTALMSAAVTGPNPLLTLKGTTSGDLLSVQQSGLGTSAHFKGGSGVLVENNLSVTGGTITAPSLNINGNLAGDLVSVTQSGAGNSAHFKGGKGVNVENGLSVSGANANELVLVNQTGAGNSAHFKGGKGVSVENGLSVFGDTTMDKTLSVSGDTRINDQTMWFRGGGDQNHGLGYFGTGKQFAGSNVNGPVLFGYSGGLLGIKQSNNEAFALSWKTNGYVGIATLNPASPLSVKGGIAVGSYSETAIAPAGGMVIEGVVGIGTPTVTQAKLQVNGSVLGAGQSFAYFAFRSDNPNPFTGTAGASGLYNSIYADNRVVGGEFDAISDVRIKNVIGRSDSAGDLATLMRVEVTDYTYKDTAARGNHPQKKLIGQQLVGVYDHAVSYSKDVVPDIYQTAHSVDGWIDLETTLLKGDRVRIIPENGDEALVEVIEVESNRFRVAPGPTDGAVFVYGRLVDDFHTVDYDAVAMLNVSATQQIKREKDAEVQALRDENAALRARLDKLESLLERMMPEEKSAVAGH